HEEPHHGWWHGAHARRQARAAHEEPRRRRDLGDDPAGDDRGDDAGEVRRVPPGGRGHRRDRGPARGGRPREDAVPPAAPAADVGGQLPPPAPLRPGSVRAPRLKGIWLLDPEEPVPAGFPLWRQRRVVAAGEVLACEPGEQTIYVLEGSLVVDGRTCPAG